MGRGGAWGGCGKLEPEFRDLRNTELWKWQGLGGEVWSGRPEGTTPLLEG